MDATMIGSIAHPTDLSPESLPAFEHALRLALLNRSELTLIHVCEAGERDRWDSFPKVRETMARWGFLGPEARHHDVLPQTGVAVRKVEIDSYDVVDGLAKFLLTQPTDLLVIASHGRAGINALFGASIAAELAHVSMVTTLIFGPEARSFVDPDTGSHERIKKVLVPVDHHPPPHSALRRLYALAEGLDVEFDYIHIGNKAPLVAGNKGRAQVRTLEGSVIETLLLEAEQADLIAMPMVGRRGFLDALRGSTTERVVKEAVRPVLALPT
jgi:nucleotide-binding universal stress UspA family protein